MRTREHFQASSFNKTFGADTERIQRMFSLLSPSVQPCSMALGTLASKQRPQIAAWKLALSVCRKRQSLHGGSWPDSPVPLCTEKLLAQLVDTVVPCSAVSALVASAASIHCAGELLKLLKELNAQFPGLAQLLEYLIRRSVLLE